MEKILKTPYLKFPIELLSLKKLQNVKLTGVTPMGIASYKIIFEMTY